VSDDPFVSAYRSRQAAWREGEERLRAIIEAEGPRPPELEYYLEQVPRDLLTTPPRGLTKPVWDPSVLNTSVSRGPQDRPMVALTIDDGAASLDETLKVIRDEGAGATFFLTGKYFDRRKDFLQQALETPGVEIANHTWNHSDLSVLGDDRIRDELTRFETMLADTIRGASSTPFMRPPGGAKSDRVVQVAAGLGYRTILWNISGDAGSLTAAQLVEHYMRQIDRRASTVDGQASYRDAWGSIILMHFRPGSCSVLPDIIRGIRARGMQPVSLSKLYEDGRT
jgi:peptidoglycan/xylan/chitin deacetylase (PgdA/CDA1 family)